jgi:RND family efflux transporter MFP subunit
MSVSVQQRRFTRAAALAVVALASVVVTWLYAHEGHAPLPSRGAVVNVAKGHIVLTREARDALDVRTAEVTTRPTADEVLAYATLVPPWTGRASIAARLAGRVTAVHVRPGQAVDAGQMLVEVDSLELESLRLELLTARSEREQVGKLLEQMSGSQPGVSEQTILEARSKLRQAENAGDVARHKWLSLGLGAERLDTLGHDSRPLTLPVRSPIRGTVTQAGFGVGKVVEPAEALFEVVDLSTVWVQIGVLERDAHRIGAGQSVELTLTAIPDTTFHATVTQVGPDIDPRTHLITAWAELTNPAGREPRLLPGMRGLARLKQPGPTNARTVPSAAVFGEGGLHFVLIEEANTAKASEYRRKDIAPGQRAAGVVEVRAGDLVPGERVVTQGGHELAGYLVPQVLRPSAVAARAIGLAVEPARPQVVEDVVELEGEIELPPDRRTFAAAPLAGTLVKLHVGPGQHVRAGAVVAEVAGLEMLSLQLDLLRTEREGRLLDETLKGLRALGGTAQRRRLLELEGQVEINRQQRDSLDRKLRALGLSDEQRAGVTAGRLVEALPIRAPIDGVVVGLDRSLGQAIPAHEPIVEIHDPSRPLVRGYVSERELPRVHLDQPARVRLTADPAFVGEAKVVRSGRVLGGDSRTLAVWAEFAAAPERPLRHGQLARLTLTTARPEPALAVPNAAVVTEGIHSYVFVQKPDGQFERRRVRTGRADDRCVEVVNGLTAGEPVAVAGAAELQMAFAVVR